MYTLHLSNGFVATQLGEMLPKGVYPTVQQLLIV